MAGIGIMSNGATSGTAFPIICELVLMILVLCHDLSPSLSLERIEAEDDTRNNPAEAD
jgi:hypothetical protein